MTPKGRWLVLLGCIALCGCAKSIQQQTYQLHKNTAFKIGDQWIISPPHEINATSIQLQRTIHRGVVAEKDEVAVAPVVQTLKIDLTNGRAALSDADGRIYPQQVEQRVVRRIHALMTDRTWQVNTIKPAKDAGIVTTYVLTVYEKEMPLKHTATWSMPPRGELPEVLTVLNETFDRAHRYAYPLSENVNLLR